MALKFQKYVQNAHQFILELAIELGAPEDLHRAERVMKAVFRTFRDRLTPSENLQLIAQLPMLIKAIYVDGWQINSEYRKLRHVSDFIQAVRAQEVLAGFPYFETDEQIEISIQAVFSVLKNYVSRGEINDLIAVLPNELKPLLEEA